MRLATVLLGLAALALPPRAAAQSLEDYDYENLAFRGLGLELGQIWPFKFSGTLSLAARADLGNLGPDVRIVPRISFWSSRLKQGEVDDLRRNVLQLCRDAGTDCLRDFGEVRVSDLSLGVDGHYTFDAGSVLVPYAGVGAALHLLNGRGELIDGTFVEDQLDAISPAVELLGGVELPLASAVRLFAEARGVLAGDVQYVGIAVGGSWSVPQAPAQRAPAAGGPR